MPEDSEQATVIRYAFIQLLLTAMIFFFSIHDTIDLMLSRHKLGRFYILLFSNHFS